MFKKLLFKVLKSLSPEEKKMFREALDDNYDDEADAEENVEVEETEEVKEDVSENTEKNDNEKGETNMSNEEEKTEKKVEDVEKTTEKTENNEVDNKENSTKPAEEVKETEEVQTAEQTSAPQVADTQPEGNGIALEDLVTQEQLTARLSAMEAKFDAVVKENKDLKDQLANMQDKYENKDFGNMQRQGVMTRDKEANSTFDEYSRQFM